ncbi:hypothetical protein SUDANB1_05601 [Streptomyces sp. enrichment culture]|uniref:hypothetical protein n=1 Tax=Streptomyces sp. enrichment culture TaxID=1795815 RepID=UPI003F55CC3C
MTGTTAPRPGTGGRPQHPRHAEIAGLLREGLTNMDAARRLDGVSKSVVRQVRIAEDIPYPVRQAETAQQKWARNVRPAGDGHAEWTGRRRNRDNQPVLRHGETTLSPARVAFTIRTGREPVGQVRAECGRPDCMAPEHVEDEPGRTRLREQLRYTLGLPPAKDRCDRGHDRAEYGRYEADGTAYCKECMRLNKGASRAKKNQETPA